MRITERRMLLDASYQVSQARERVSNVAGPVSSGIEVERPSDDPARWAEGKRAATQQIDTELRGKALGTSNARLAELDRIFGSMGGVLSRARELAVLSANATQGAESRMATAAEVHTLFDEVLHLANSRGPDGEYLLAGSRGDTEPFDSTGGYLGDSSRRTIEASIGVPLEVTVTGEHLTSVHGVDILAELAAFHTALASDDVAGIQTALGALEQGIQQISLGRAEIGGLQRAIDNAESARIDFELTLAEAHQRAVEVDPIAAASELALGTQALQAAQALAQRIIDVTKIV